MKRNALFCLGLPKVRHLCIFYKEIDVFTVIFRIISNDICDNERKTLK